MPLMLIPVAVVGYKMWQHHKEKRQQEKEENGEDGSDQDTAPMSDQEMSDQEMNDQEIGEVEIALCSPSDSSSLSDDDATQPESEEEEEETLSNIAGEEGQDDSPMFFMTESNDQDEMVEEGMEVLSPPRLANRRTDPVVAKPVNESFGAFVANRLKDGRGPIKKIQEFRLNVQRRRAERAAVVSEAANVHVPP